MPSDELQIIIGPDGNMECLDSNLIPLQELGSLKRWRASNVEPNNETQTWDVEVIDPVVADAISGGEKLTDLTWVDRSPALAEEVRVLNQFMSKNPGYITTMGREK